jgi:hypothetical protein
MEPGLVGAAGHRRIQPAVRLAADANRNVPVTNRTSREPQAGRAEANFGVKDLTMLALIKPLHLALDLRDACTQGDLSGCCGRHSPQQGGYFFCSWQLESVIGISSSISAAPGVGQSNDATVSNGSVLLRRLLRSRQCQRG